MGSGIGTLIEGFLFSDKSVSEIADEAVVATLSGVAFGAGSEFWDFAIKEANKVGSAALELMNYDENFGELIKAFFNKLGTATSACIGVDKE